MVFKFRRFRMTVLLALAALVLVTGPVLFVRGFNSPLFPGLMIFFGVFWASLFALEAAL